MQSMGLGVFGCQVRLVAAGGLAAAAGLQEGDMIVKINGRVCDTSPRAVFSDPPARPSSARPSPSSPIPCLPLSSQP